MFAIGSLHAEDSVLNGLRCGQIVTLTAMPDEGYRFVSWSDGVTDNPRRVEVTAAMQLEALFEVMCEAEYAIPVSYLYGHLYVINLNEWQALGYAPAEHEVRWYRIVGDIDDPSKAGDDLFVGTGYYLNRDGMADGAYYVQYDLPGSAERDCSNVLRSKPFYISASAVYDAESSRIRVVPTVVEREQMVEIQGLPVADDCTLRVYDPTGRLLRTMTSQGNETALLPTDRQSGCYLIRVSTRTIERTLIYIVH